MVYVERDNENHVIAVYNTPTNNAIEKLAPTHPEVMAFLFGGTEQSEAKQNAGLYYLQEMHFSNLEVSRTQSELIAVLLDRGVIQLSDLPEFAMRRLQQHHHIRQRLQTVDELVAEDALVDC